MESLLMILTVGVWAVISLAGRAAKARRGEEAGSRRQPRTAGTLQRPVRQPAKPAPRAPEPSRQTDIWEGAPLMRPTITEGASLSGDYAAPSFSTEGEDPCHDYMLEAGPSPGPAPEAPSPKPAVAVAIPGLSLSLNGDALIKGVVFSEILTRKRGRAR